MSNDQYITACRHHTISMGHCVSGHMEEEVVDGKVVEKLKTGKCFNPHGHNYEFIFHVRSKLNLNQLDKLGRVIDFGIIKSILCEWLEQNWDHKFLIYENDVRCIPMTKVFNNMGIIKVPFNPTVENIAFEFIENIAPQLLKDTAVELCGIKIYETPKCFCELKL